MDERLRNFVWVVPGVYFVMLVYSGYVSRVDCGTAVATFKNRDFKIRYGELLLRLLRP